jgi:NADH-quinone oxidoreductase subunit A
VRQEDRVIPPPTDGPEPATQVMLDALEHPYCGPFQLFPPGLEYRTRTAEKGMAEVSVMAQSDPRIAWLPVVLLVLMGLGFAVANIVLSLIIGPKRTGPGKETTYESGMVPTGDARRRFNVRFYIVAMVFLVFDVEIVFFYPWATLFPDALAKGVTGTGVLLLEMFVFVAILLVAYFYAWGKGVFKWD